MVSSTSKSDNPNAGVPWTEQEDEDLLAAMLHYGTRWDLLKQRMPSRTEDALRLRWHQRIKQRTASGDWHQRIKQRMANGGRKQADRCNAQKLVIPTSRSVQYTAEEDRIILEGSDSRGRKWRKLAKMLPGRTDSSVRNRWGRLQKARKQGQRVPSAEPAPTFTPPLSAVVPSIPTPHDQMTDLPAQAFPPCCIPTLASAPVKTEDESLCAPSSGVVRITIPYTAQTDCLLAPSVPSVTSVSAFSVFSAFSQSRPTYTFACQDTDSASSDHLSAPVAACTTPSSLVAILLAAFNRAESGSCGPKHPRLYLATQASSSMLTSEEAPVAMPCIGGAPVTMACMPRSGCLLAPFITPTVTPTDHESTSTPSIDGIRFTYRHAPHC